MADAKAVARKRSKSFAKPVAAPPAVKPTYDVPKWAGKPPQGMHLDVMKEGKLIEKFIVDGKTHFFFGRQREFIDFTIDHTSCSRVHAVIVYHKHLNRMFLIDLGSTHGTFLGSIRLEANKPMQLPVDDVFSFGASTRTWMLRERPNIASNLPDSTLNSSLNETNESESNKSLLGLPEAENELHDLTEFNTAHNRRIATLPIDETNPLLTRKRRRSSANVTFSINLDEIINPEDVDPTVGRFRNLISTEIIIPNKKSKQLPAEKPVDAHVSKHQQEFQTNHLYNDSSDFSDNALTSPITLVPKISSAPDVDAPDMNTQQPVMMPQFSIPFESFDRGVQEPAKKKYVKEAWPGRKPGKGQNLLSV